MAAHVARLALPALFLALPHGTRGHGHMTLPASTRQKGSLALGNNCENQACFWFSNNVEIPGSAPTLRNSLRSVQINVTGQPADVYATSPWRAPGTAPVFGSGCGSAGGGKEAFLNGGSIRGYPQGMDGADLPPHGEPAVWTRGGTAEVAFAIAANHGGGYSYRLCPLADGPVSEACFQAHQLDFSGTESAILYPNGSRSAFPRVATREGTYPPGSQWARNPVPGCFLCDAYKTCGAPLAPVPGTGPTSPCKGIKTEARCEATNASSAGDRKCVWYGDTCFDKGPTDTCLSVKTEARCEATRAPSGGMCSWYAPKSVCYDKGGKKPSSPAQKWDQQVNCYANCDGTGSREPDGTCAPGTAQFPEPVPGISGFGKHGWAWSVADTVAVPRDLPPGKYLLSWRWDCEESTQVWENCADVVLE